MPVLGVRHGQVFLLFATQCVNFALRSNLAVAVVAMTDKTQSHQTVAMTTAQKGVLLGILGYGCLVSSIPGGILARRFGTRRLLGLSTLVSSLTTVLFPVVSVHLGYLGACGARVILGLCQGMVFPSINHHVARWSAREERGFFIASIYTGSSVGMVIMESTAGVIISEMDWPSVFYISGAVSAVWSLNWFAFARDCVEDHKTISMTEKLLIGKYTSISPKQTIPWLKIGTSIPFWALLIVQFGTVFGTTLQETLLPTYLKDIYGFNTANSGLYSALPPSATLICSIMVPWIGKMTDKCCSRLSLTWQRKIWTSIGAYGGSVVLLTISQFQLGPTAAIVCLTISKGLVATHHLGLICGDVDLAPNFAGILNGIDFGLAGNLGSLSSPALSGLLLYDESDASDWSNVFLMGAMVQIVANTIYLIFGSAEVQPWNEPNVNRAS